MYATSISDLSQHFQTLRHTANAKVRLNTLAEELATGRVSDLTTHLRGETGQIVQLDREIALLDSFAQGGSLLTQRFAQSQVILDGLDSTRETLAAQTLQAAQISSDTQLDAAERAGRKDFAAVVSNLNTQIAGRSLFAGTAVNGAALASADVMMADIISALGGATDPDTVIAVVDSWFDDPAGGFEMQGYIGNSGTAPTFQIGRSESVSDPAKADALGIRAVLKGVAMAAVAAEISTSLSTSDRAKFMVAAGERLLSAATPLTQLRAEIGREQQTLEEADVARTAQHTAFSTARNDLVTADPFETATRLQDAQQQLELQYAATARLSRLSLVNFL